MKTLLIVGGVLFLLLAFVLFIAAIVVFFIVRKRRASAAPVVASPVPQPAPRVAPPPPLVPHVPPPPPSFANTAPPPPPPPSFANAAPPPPPRPPEPEPFNDDRTVMTDPRRAQSFGTLIGTSGPLTGRTFPVDAAGFYIGRDRLTSQVVIDSPSISKRHLWIGARDNVVMAIDQNSTNGTFLNDPNQPITESPLAPGDTIILGGDVARFEYRA